MLLVVVGGLLAAFFIYRRFVSQQVSPGVTELCHNTTDVDSKIHSFESYFDGSNAPGAVTDNKVTTMVNRYYEYMSETMSLTRKPGN